MYSNSGIEKVLHTGMYVTGGILTFAGSTTIALLVAERAQEVVAESFVNRTDSIEHPKSVDDVNKQWIFERDNPRILVYDGS